MSIIRAAQSNSFFNALLFSIFLTVLSPPVWAGDTAWPSTPIKDTVVSTGVTAEDNVLQVDKGRGHKNSPAAKADNKKNKKADATAKKASNGYGKNG